LHNLKSFYFSKILGIPLENHKPIKLLIYSAIAIAEEITGKTKDIVNILPIY
jgi:hypothetical protein